MLYLSFLPARCYASAGLCDSDVSVCLSVWTSVCHTPVLCLAERNQDREVYTLARYDSSKNSQGVTPKEHAK